MINTIFNNGSSHYGLTLIDIDKLNDISVIFDTVESRDQFCSQFQKSLKIYCGFINAYENEKTIRHPYASARMMPTQNRYGKVNSVTGLRNEVGEKRIRAFYNAVQNELTKQKSIK